LLSLRSSSAQPVRSASVRWRRPGRIDGRHHERRLVRSTRHREAEAQWLTARAAHGHDRRNEARAVREGFGEPFPALPALEIRNTESITQNLSVWNQSANERGGRDSKPAKSLDNLESSGIPKGAPSESSISPDRKSAEARGWPDGSGPQSEDPMVLVLKSIRAAEARGEDGLAGVLRQALLAVLAQPSPKK
jgi:hypothetical protein